MNPSAKTVSMTPSEFVISVSQGIVQPDQLVQCAGTANNVMLELYNISAMQPAEDTAGILIESLTESSMEIAPNASMWAEVLNIALAAVRNGKTPADGINILLENNFERFMKPTEVSSLGIRNLFDQAFYLIIHTVRDGKVPTVH